MRTTAVHEAVVLIDLQKKTPYGEALRKERGLMMIEKVSQVHVRKQLQAMAWVNELKAKSIGHSPKARELFRVKKYEFANLPYRLQGGF